MSQVEDAEKLLCFLEKLREFVSGKQLYKVLILSAIVASVLLLMGQIKFTRDILEPMYTTIRMLLSWVLVLSVVTTSSLWIVDKGEELIQARKRKREEAEKRATEERGIEEARAEEARAIAEAEAERERQAQQECERIAAQIISMSDVEREIFSEVKSSGGCGVWVARDDAVVQTLLHRGLLERIGEVETWQDWEGGYDGRAWCILVEIPARVKAVAV